MDSAAKLYRFPPIVRGPGTDPATGSTRRLFLPPYLVVNTDAVPGFHHPESPFFQIPGIKNRFLARCSYGAPSHALLPYSFTFPGLGPGFGNDPWTSG